MSVILRKILKRHWLDLTACAIFPLVLLVLTSDYYKNRAGLGIDAEMLPFALPLWIIIRMLFQVSRITERSRREQLAITLLPAREFLQSALKLPIIMILVSTAPFLFLFYREIRGVPFTISDAISILFLIILIIAPLAGVIHSLRCFCRSRPILAFTLPFIYYSSVFLIVIMLNLLMRYAYKNNYMRYEHQLFGFFIICIWVYIILLMRNWRSACTAYYVFE